jgi:type II secretory pathway component HofQ
VTWKTAQNAVSHSVHTHYRVHERKKKERDSTNVTKPSTESDQAHTTEVLVDNGGTVVFGGVIQNQSNLTIEQVPLLGSIPVIGHLFKRTGVSTETNELLFFITPKIV